MKIKCIDNKGNHWFRVGSEYKAWYEDTLLCSDSEWDTCYHSSLNNGHGAFEVIEEEKQHPHADLMLKYAMIAQYDDKPWECFQFYSTLNKEWTDLACGTPFSSGEYRLKPQEPKIQVGHIWISKEGVEVVVDTPSDKNTIYFKYHLGGLLIKNAVSFTHFIKNFKRKE